MVQAINDIAKGEAPNVELPTKILNLLLFLWESFVVFVTLPDSNRD